MCNSTNTSTSTTTLPAELTAGLSTGMNKSINASNLANPAAGLAQKTADWGNPSQYNAAVTANNLQNFQAQQVGSGYQAPQAFANYNTPAGAYGYYDAPQAYTQFQAPQVTGGYQPQQVGASNVTQFGSLSGQGGINGYMNPYTSGVINTSLDELNRQLEKTNQGAAGQAASAGAFGGDRAAIVQSENARNADQIAAQTIAGLNSQNYTQAAANAQQDASRALQAGTSQGQLNANVGEANQYAGLQGASLDAQQQRANQSAGLATQSLVSQADRANQVAAMTTQALDSQNQRANQSAAQTTQALNSQADRSNQAAGLTTQALNAQQERANQTAGLNAANVGLSAAQESNQIGNTVQQTQQAYNQNQYNQQYRDAMYPVTSAQTLASQLGTLGGIYPRTTTTSTPVSTTGQIAGLATTAAGLNSLSGGSLVSGVKSLFGSGNSGSDTSAFDTSIGNLTDTTGTDLSNVFDTSGVTFARGGLVGYARGGEVRGYDEGGPVDDTYAPIGQDDPREARIAALRRMNAGLAIAAAPTNPQGDYAGYAPSAGQGRQANVGGLAAAQPQQSQLQQALAVIPADYLTGAASPQQAEQQVATPAPDQGAAQPQQSDPRFQALLSRIGSEQPQQPQAGLGQAQPDAAPASQPQAGLGASPFDTPASQQAGIGQPPPAPDRMAQSANPSNPLPGGTDPNDWTHNKVGMALLSAGLGMMASKSQNALGAIGEGGQKGVETLQAMTRQQTDADLKRYLYGSRAAIGQENADTRKVVAATGQQRADTYADHTASQDENQAARIAQQAPVAQARIAKLYSDAEKNDRSVTPAQAQQAAIDSLVHPADGSQGMSQADAYAQVRNFTATNAYRQSRLGQIDRGQDQRDTQIENTQDFRQWQAQRQVNRDEITELNNMSSAAALNAKPFDRDSALGGIRARKDRMGPAAGGYTPQGQSQQAQAPQGGQQQAQMRPATDKELASAKAALARNVPRQTILQHAQSNGVILNGL